jgi:hypothetical protein
MEEKQTDQDRDISNSKWGRCTIKSLGGGDNGDLNRSMFF